MNRNYKAIYRVPILCAKCNSEDIQDKGWNATLIFSKFLIFFAGNPFRIYVKFSSDTKYGKIFTKINKSVQFGDEKGNFDPF